MKRILAFLVLLLVLTSSCSAREPEQPDAVSSSTLQRYAPLEIHEYQGLRLDPSVGPRDNSISGVQHIDIDAYTLTIRGLVDNSLTLSYDEVLHFKQYERLITLYCVEGWNATILWRGVKLTDLIDEAGAGEAAKTVIFTAADGYTTSLPLDIVRERDLLLAFSSNGIDLPPEMGYPFIVVAEDKLGYKWCRWVTEIELSDDENYEGFWEQRGYSNDADLN